MVQSKYEVPEKIRKKLGLVIKSLREEKKYGLNKFCKEYGIQSSMYSKLENGLIKKINPYLLQMVAKGLGIDYKTLYMVVDYLEPSSKLDDIKLNEKRIEA